LPEAYDSCNRSSAGSSFAAAARYDCRYELLAGQQIPALLRFGFGNERKEIVKRLFALLGVMHSLVGRVQARLTGSRNEEESDEKADQQHRR
jgi:hypothetical protein